MRGFVDMLVDHLYRLGHLTVAAFLMQTVKAGSQSIDHQRIFSLDSVDLLLQSVHALFESVHTIDHLVIQLVSADDHTEYHRHSADDLGQFYDIDLQGISPSKTTLKLNKCKVITLRRTFKIMHISHIQINMCVIKMTVIPKIKVEYRC